jgi:tetratricopeptide (TPR) repeat protein
VAVTAAAAADADVVASLNGLIGGESAARTAATDVADLVPRLAGHPFESLVAAMERGRPTLDARTEIALYQAWIDANTGKSPLLFAAWFNLGTALTRLGEHGKAITAYRNALALKPDLYAASINLGQVYEALGQPWQAQRVWEQALQPDEARAALLIQRGRLLETTGQLP